jgi:alkane 1-monooxygenase
MSADPENISAPASWGEILPFLFPTLVGLTCIYTYYNYKSLFIIVWILYTLIPWIDYVIPVDHSNLPENRVRIYEKDRRFLVPLYSFFVLDFIFFYWVLYDVYSGKVGTSISSFFILAFCLAQLGAVNAVVGHELFHKKALIHKICGTLVYAKMIYGHFFIQHTRSHHKHVATPLDPSTSRLGESLYYFFCRAIP